MNISNIYNSTDTPDGRQTFIWLVISQEWVPWVFLTWEDLRNNMTCEDHA